MIIIRGIDRIKKYKNAVVALGVFDGVHHGHRNILQGIVKIAHRVKGKSIAITFFPHPQDKESLYSLEHRLRLIEELGVDVCIVVNFTRSFANIEADDFIVKILIKKIGASFICVGKNFRFGREAIGNYRLLKEYSRKYNFKLKLFNVVKSKGLPISSTVIRKLIKSSKIKKAQELLGRRVSILGTVIKGTRLGRLLGFPTANINPYHEVIPATGIYVVQIIFLAKAYDGICYIGTRPTISAKSKSIHVEVHIFNFHRNIYGSTLEIQFIKMIRGDQKFDSIRNLTLQIQKDIIACRKILRHSFKTPQ
ncbi:MAG: bifunctional riboflavin kinase/FAD synthetase [Candidatus Omnitrophica bacterium]|nr:bifunctional riboflavin kinase/FAD synthetase [Candidatus Omnitrophota bacterium]